MSTAVLGGGAKIQDRGEHFTDEQTKDDKFRNVSNIWTRQCMTFDQGIEKLNEQQQVIRDLREPLSAFSPVVTSKGEFALRYNKTGQEYVPTEHALTHIAVVGETSDWMLQDLRREKEGNTKKQPVKFTRDFTDAELMVRIVGHTLFHPSRMDQSKVRLFRTWTNGTLRALLSSKYAIVNNAWYINVLRDLIPGGLLSHWRGDADTVFGNVLIPDTIRQESDSAYGGMLSIGNSEIGLRRIMSLPSVFRAICMNGCIWEPQKGKSVRKVHRGDVDLEGLKFEIKQNLELQIPLLPDGIKQLLGLRGRGFGNASVAQTLAAFAISFKVSRSNMVGIRKALEVEQGILGDKEAKTAFGLANAVTRHGQTLDTQEWVDFDQIGGQLTMQTETQWNALRTHAASLSDTDEIEKLIGLMG